MTLQASPGFAPNKIASNSSRKEGKICNKTSSVTKAKRDDTEAREWTEREHFLETKAMVARVLSDPLT